MQTDHRNLDQRGRVEAVFAIAGSMALAIRLVQGWILWGGASRRLFYDLGSADGVEYAVKMDPGVPGYVAAKLSHAMPGSLFPELIQRILLQPELLHLLVWFWTLVELVVGIGLILGLATRTLAFASVGINVSLMLIFGWMGSTCVDEWTMAASGFAMGATLMLTGGGSWSLDHWLSRRFPGLSARAWVRLLGSGPLPLASMRHWGLALGLLSLLFSVGFYQYLHGGVFGPLHARVSFHRHDLALADARAQPDGEVRFRGSITAGPDTGKLYLIRAALLNGDATVAEWDGTDLAGLQRSAIDNRFNQPWAAKIEPTLYGLGGTTGAEAVIRLPAKRALQPGPYRLALTDIDGRQWQTAVAVD